MPGKIMSAIALMILITSCHPAGKSRVTVPPDEPVAVSADAASVSGVTSATGVTTAGGTTAATGAASAAGVTTAGGTTTATGGATVEQERPRTNFQRPETWLMGYFQQDLLTKPPHEEWFMPQYNSYQPNEELVFRIAETNMAEVSVLIVLGTWCPDTRREVPRFFKLADQCGMNRMKITLLGADMNKFAPIGDYDKLGILKVPTFIVYRNNIEAGRIIEYPQTSLEGDLAEILLKKQD